VPLAVVLLAAGLFRAVYFHFYAHTGIFFDALILDSGMLDAWAKRIAAGDWIGTEVFYFPPLYPYLLGALYRLAGPALDIVYLTQQALGLVNLFLIYRIGTRAFGRRAALWAAGGAALYGPFAFFETKLLATTLGLTLNLVALAALVRAGMGTSRWWRWWVAGWIIGVAAIALPATILLAVLSALARLPRDWRSSAALAAGALVALLPVAAHNQLVAGDPMFLSAQGGITFYQGNNPRALGRYDVPPGFTGAPELQAAEERAIAEKEIGRPLRRSEISRHFLGKGLAFIASSPGQALALEARKLAALFGDYEAPTEYSLYMERGEIAWLRIAFLPFAAIAALGAAGLLFAGGFDGVAAFLGRGAPPPRAAARGALFLYTVYAAAVPLLFYVSSRYRLPLCPALLIYGGAFVDRCAAAIRAGRAPAAAEGRGVVVALALGIVSFTVLGERNVTTEANVHYNFGNALADRGRDADAVAAFDRALAGWPTHAFALINRGLSLDRIGQDDLALDSYRRAEAARPDLFKAYSAEGAILHRLGRHEEEADAYRRGSAAGGAQASFLLASALRESQRLDEASAAITEALRKQPDEPRYHVALAGILEGEGKPHAAVDAYLDAIRLDPRSARTRFELARVYRELGKIDLAETACREGLRIDPRSASGYAQLGDLLAVRKDRAGAEAAYRSALAIDPRAPGAREGLARLGE
jgi:tetratricopeptide (TPR) repeat protein